MGPPRRVGRAAPAPKIPRRAESEDFFGTPDAIGAQRGAVPRISGIEWGDADVREPEER